MEGIGTRWLRCPTWLAVLSLGFVATPLAAQQCTLSARVADTALGTAVAGATVEDVGESLGSTDAAGGFSGSVPAGDRSAIITLIGYETTRVDGIASLMSPGLRIASRPREEAAHDGPVHSPSA